MIDLCATFEKHDNEYNKFDRVENKLHHRPDMCAFLLIDRILPGHGDMVCGAAHDEIFLDADIYRLAEVATDEDILTLVRCGVRLDSESDGLAMFA